MVCPVFVEADYFSKKERKHSIPTTRPIVMSTSQEGVMVEDKTYNGWNTAYTASDRGGNMNDLSPEQYAEIEAVNTGWHTLGDLFEIPPLRFRAHQNAANEWILTGATRNFDDSLEVKCLKDGRLFWSRPGISVWVD